MANSADGDGTLHIATTRSTMLAQEKRKFMKNKINKNKINLTSIK